MNVNTAKAEAFIRDILSMPEDEHKVFTPFALCNEVLDKIPSLNGNILVVANLEFVYTILLRGVDRNRVFFATPNDTKARAAEQMQIGGVYKYNNIITKEDVGDMKFDVAVGNPPYSVGNTGKGGTAIYHKFAEVALSLADTVAFITPGSFVDQDKYKSFRATLNARGVGGIYPVDPQAFDASVERPCWWIVTSTATGTVEGITSTPEKILLEKLKQLAVDNTFLTKSGKADVSEPTVGNASSSRPRKYISRVIKDGPVVEFCSPSIFNPLSATNGLAVFAQRGGTEPKVFFVDDAKSHGFSQNVIAISIKADEFDTFVSYVRSSVVRFILHFATAGKNTKKGMPRALTAGKIRWIPKVDLSRSWTDEQLYKHFNLTDEEIKLIEDTIK